MPSGQGPVEAAAEVEGAAEGAESADAEPEGPGEGAESVEGLPDVVASSGAVESTRVGDAVSAVGAVPVEALPGELHARLPDARSATPAHTDARLGITRALGCALALSRRWIPQEKLQSRRWSERPMAPGIARARETLT